LVRRSSKKGFRDHSGSYGLENFTLTAIFVSDHIFGMNDGPTGDDVLELTLPDDLDFDSWEIIEEDRCYREWCVRAELFRPVYPAADDLTTRRSSSTWAGPNGPERQFLWSESLPSADRDTGLDSLRIDSSHVTHPLSQPTRSAKASSQLSDHDSVPTQCHVPPD
jgi:hypothetical protein